MIRFFKKKRIPDDVEEDLQRAVGILVESKAPIKWIRLFGSLNNGKWIRYWENGRTSDIDLAILMEDDLRYSNFAERRTFTLDPTPDPRLWEFVSVLYCSTPERQELSDRISKSDLEFRSKYSLHIVTPSDLRRMRKEKFYFQNMPHDKSLSFGRQNLKNAVKAMEKGRLLYPLN